MTHQKLNPYQGLGLGGGLYGGHRQADAQAPNSAYQAAYYAQQQAVARGFAAQQAWLTRLGTAPPPVEDAGISAGEIVAYRVWEVERGLLKSMVASYVWRPGEIAEGNVAGGFGLHAFKAEGDAVAAYREVGHRVIGRVLLWGEVIEHERGYRAQYGAVDALLAIISEPSITEMFWRRGLLNRLRKTYGVEHRG